jgi:hypothetical protein
MVSSKGGINVGPVDQKDIQVVGLEVLEALVNGSKD